MTTEADPTVRAEIHIDETDENILSTALYDAGLSELSPTTPQDEASVERVWQKILQTINSSDQPIEEE